MKRILKGAALTLAACCALGFAACNGAENEPTKLYSPYYEEDLQTITFVDMTQSLTLDMSANTYLKDLLLQADYYEYTPSQDEVAQVKYALQFADVELQIFSAGLVRFVYANEEETEWTVAQVENEEFSYLDTILTGGEVAFDGYTAEQTITVKNGENNDGTISDKENFLATLADMRFIKVSNKTHYQTGSVRYTLTIGEENILFYDNYASKNGELYILSQGDYEFLKALQYGFSSDWLPWL